MGFIKFLLGWVAAIFVGFVLFALLKTNDPNAPPTAYDFRVLVEAQLKDADSAKFRNEAVYPVAGKEKAFTMCGEVNAKNSYGAYTGFKRVIASATSGRVLTDDGTEIFDKFWWSQCKTPSNS